MSILHSSCINEELRMLHDSALDFSEANFAPQTQARERQGMCHPQAWRGGGEAGVLCASIPESYGGAGGNECHEATIYDAMIRGGAAVSIAGGNTVHSQRVDHYFQNRRF